MAEKRKDFKEYGYEDERFEPVISDCHNLHCAICSNVFNDPVMCKNEHCFCRACITEHLQNSQNCPCCNQHLSVESLTDAPRILRNLLSELRIRCDYHKRGCEAFVQLGNLASHVATCAKAPVVCANKECSSEMNREDQARHESEECRFRKVKCRNCKEMDAMMQEIGASLGGLSVNVCEHRSETKTGLIAVENRLGELENRFENVEKKFGEVENRFQKVENGFEKVENRLGRVEIKFDKLENQFEKVEIGDLRYRDERRKSMNDVKCTGSDQATQADLVSEVQVAKSSNENAFIVAGGYGSKRESLNSVEIFDKSTNSWRQLQSMKKCRADASSVFHKGQVLVTGGLSDGRNILSSIEQFMRNPIPFAPPYWSNFSVNLPRAFYGHASVVYNDRLLVIGGYDEEDKLSYVIYEIQLCFPFNTKVLAKIPSPRPITSCGVALVDDKILIFGGGQRYESAIANVGMYDITRKEFRELAPLPYRLCGIATVKYGENVILAGCYYDFARFGCYKSTVISYNVETQKSVKLPSMNDMRFECRAVVDRDSVVVMGGRRQDGSLLNSVEALDFRSSGWRNLPSMNEARRGFVLGIV